MPVPDTVFCRYCKGEMPSTATSCHHCGKAVPSRRVADDFVTSPPVAPVVAPPAVRTAATTVIPPLRSTTLGTGARVWLVLSAFALIIGLLFSSQATSGVAIIGSACLFGIFARIDQAARHHEEMIEALRQIRGQGHIEQ
jgi:hypothetical protein